MTPLESTIQSYLAANKPEAILSLVQSLIDQRDRAEFKVRAYEHEIRVLAERYSQIVEPATGRLITDRAKPEPKSALRSASVDSEAPTKSKPPAIKPIKKPSLALDIDL